MKVLQTKGISEWAACRLAGLDRTTLRYVHVPPKDGDMRELVKELPVLEPSAPMGSFEVIHLLEGAIAWNGKPVRIRSDNGSEFISLKFVACAYEQNIEHFLNRPEFTDCPKLGRNTDGPGAVVECTAAKVGVNSDACSKRYPKKPMEGGRSRRIVIAAPSTTIKSAYASMPNMSRVDFTVLIWVKMCLTANSWQLATEEVASSTRVTA